MRVVSGIAGGLRLQAPSSGVRPTMDRVRAAIFSMLGEGVHDARVLDLFAGAGTLGIEALSRGAASVLFVEKDAPAIACIEENLAKTRFQAEILETNVLTWLERGGVESTFDLIFADPPYARNGDPIAYTSILLGSPAITKMLAQNGLLVIEKAPEEPMPDARGWEILKRRRYGKTEVLICATVNP